MLDCAVVGAGPAGLAMSATLAVRGVDHVVLEKGRPGETWRGQRWESFRLNTPEWMNQLLHGAVPGILFGFPSDAEAIADAVKARLAGVGKSG